MKKNFTILLATVISLIVVFFACKKELPNEQLNPELKAGKISVMSTPIVSCSGVSTPASLSIVVTAGATGAPAGFSLQWMTAAEYAANNNTWSDTPCKASFSGNANLSRYNLAPGESVTLIVGEFLFDNGASTNCAQELMCGTDYVFRAFAHANNTMNRSQFSSNVTCSTSPCNPPDGGCTYTQGYWKTHGPVPVGNNINEWTVTSLVLGTVNYTDLELLAIFNTPASGNGLIALAHQLIAAKLNIAHGSDGTAVAAAIAAADALIGSKVVPPVGAGYLAPSATSALITTLTNYNEGAIGPGHCN